MKDWEKIVLFLFAFSRFVDCFNNRPVNGFPDGLQALADKIYAGQAFARNDDLRQQLMTSLRSSFPSNSTLLSLIKSADEVGEESQCRKDIINMIVNLLQSADYGVVSMFDSFGKIGSDILDGNLIWPGSYSECRKLKANFTVARQNETFLTGQYCWATLELSEKIKNAAHIPPSPFPLALQTAVCFPDSCSINQTKKALEALFWPISSLLNFTSVTCFPKNIDFWSDKGAVASLVILFLFGILLLIGTAYDVIYYRNKYFTSFKYTASLNNSPSKIDDPELSETVESSETDKHINGDSSLANGDSNYRIIAPQTPNIGICGEILLSFSVYANGAKLLSLSPGSRTLKPLNGIRFLSMTWIIMGHTFLLGSLLIDNQKILLDVMKTFAFQIVIQATLAVDTFFVLSGLLVAYLFGKDYEYRNGKISWLKFYLHRYWRLTPMYILILVLIRNNLNRYFSDGPFWPLSGFEGDNCSKNWWWNILYINNFISVEKMCMGHSWYLANDMQFYILSPLILIPLAKKWFSLAAAISGIFILISSISTGVLSSHYNISAVIDLTKIAPGSPDYNTLFNVVYDKPYCRISAYVIGMICGWLLYKTSCKVEMKKHWVILGWSLAVACNLAVTIGLYQAHPTQAVSSLYLALARIGWSLGLCWLIFACCTGYGGFINSLLSWPVWNPFSRLTYSVYLIHVIIIQAVFYSSDVVGHFSYTTLILYHFGFVVCSYLLGLIISLAFESPFLAVEKLICNRRQEN